MKVKTIEELRKEFDFPLKALKLKEAPFWMLYSEFLEQKLIQPEPQREVEELKVLIYESLGSASMCWSEMPRGDFNEKQAIEIGNKLINAMHEYANQKQEKPLTEWISVKDRLPKEYCHCLIYCPSSFPKNIRVLSATFYDDNNMFYCDASEMPHEDVTHWMPLPEPPKQ